MNECVVAVTVTYNDFSYLKKALTALREQTVPLTHIVVIDNNSSDENKSLLSDEQDSLVDVLWLDENIGGAGGFEAGMRYAHEKYDPDWYWLMDADAYPRQDCLELLLSHNQDSKNIGILAPLIYGVDLQQYQLYHIKNVSKLLYRDILLYSSVDDIPNGVSKLETDAFVGPLISKKAVEELGYADGDLFIYGDDHEYTYRVTRKFDMLLVKEAIINHRDQPVNGQQRPENWWKEYYAFRNRILFIKKYQKGFLHGVICQGMFLFRVIKAVLKNIVSGYNNELKKYKKALILQSVKDGYLGLNGKTVDPIIEKNKVKSLML